MLLKFFFVICISISISANNKLTNEEIKVIDNYINTTPIEQTIGQLFIVGIKTDVNNYQEASIINKLIKKEMFGSIMLNTYNYSKSDTSARTINNIINFHNFLQDTSKSSLLGLPLLLTVDFETPKFSSIQNGLVQPIPPMVLSATQDSKILFNSGYINGLQLSSIGINLLLGPTLDIYNVNQEASKFVLQNRAFAGNAKGVIATASHFLRGLKESNINFIIKHIPGHGSVESNPHDKTLPQYGGSKEQFNEDIKPFNKFKKYSNGIMTSHIVMPAFTNIDNQLITFSKSFFKKYLLNDSNNTLFVTDDLSGMGAINKYMDENNRTISNIAIDAFNAGHDLLLFSHVSKQDGGIYTNITKSDDLITVKNNLLQHIIDTHNEERFKISLKKVLMLKAKIHKENGYSIKNLFVHNKVKSSSWRIRNSYDEIQVQQNKLLKKYGITSIKDFSYNAILSGATIIHKHEKLQKFIDLKVNSKISIYCKKDYIPKFKNILKNKTNKLIYLKEKKFESTKNNIIDKIKESNYTIFIVDDINSRNILDHIRIEDPKLSNKIIVFILSSPLILTKESISKFHIITLSTRHEQVFKVIQSILNENVELKNIINFPLKIGKNGVYHSLDNVQWVDQYKIISEDTNTSSKIYFNKCVDYPIYLFLYIFIITALFFLYLIIKKYKAKDWINLFKNDKLAVFLVLIIIVNLIIMYNLYLKHDEIKNNEMVIYIITIIKYKLSQYIDS